MMTGRSDGGTAILPVATKGVVQPVWWAAPQAYAHIPGILATGPIASTGFGLVHDPIENVNTIKDTRREHRKMRRDLGDAT